MSNFVTLGDVCILNPKKSETKNLSLDTEVTFVGMKDVSEDGVVSVSDTRTIDEVYKGFTYFREGDVLFAKITPCMENGKGGIAVGLKNGIGFGSTEFHVLRVKDNVHNGYINHLLMSRWFRKQAETQMTGSAGQKRVPIDFFKSYKIPLPPLEDQKRIAAILDAADALRQKDRALIAKYEELTQSLFLDMFGDPVTNPKGWKSEKLGSLTNMIGSGSTPKGGSEVYQRHGYLFIRSQNIRSNKVDYDDIYFIDEGIHTKMKRTWVKNEDVLLNITGASIGRAAIFYGDDDSANVNQHVCIIRLNRQKLYPKFLLHHLVQENYQNKIIGIGSGGTREAFNFKQIKNFEVIVPPVKLQNQFAELIEHIEKQKQLAQQSLQKSEELFNSLLQRAFKGELTDTKSSPPLTRSHAELVSASVLP
jgi:type I restriction enzyme, S subunit